MAISTSEVVKNMGFGVPGLTATLAFSNHMIFNKWLFISEYQALWLV